MTTKTPFEKRVKRRIIGRNHEFFIAAAQGFEKLCQGELTSLPVFNNKETILYDGGIAFQGRIHECYIANLHLHTAGRILMRIHEFKSTNFRQLKKRMDEIAWDLYCHPNTRPSIRVTSKNSRLYHKNAVAEIVSDSIAERFKQLCHLSGHDRTPSQDQTVFVRATNDRFSVSIDSSGELLYKRGVKTQGGKAPIRETIAAAALKLSGFTGREPLVDPMCGSGTFSIEGAFMVNHIPAGWFREFAFMGWPSFRSKKWEYIKKQAWDGVVQTEKPVIFASDKDSYVCDRLKREITQYPFSSSINIHCRDFFNLTPLNIDESNAYNTGLMVINPPYGLRMETKNTVNKLIPEILKKLIKDFQGWKLAMVIPHKSFLNNVPFKYRIFPFSHGGLDLYLLIGRIRY